MNRIHFSSQVHRARGEHCRGGLRLLVLVGFVGLLIVPSGCIYRRSPPLTDAAQLQLTIRDLLNEEETTPEYHEMRMRIQDMGPEVDAVLLALARNQSVNTRVRANALLLIAERRTPGALDVLSRALTPESSVRLRTAAVMGLQRLAPFMPEAMRLIRTMVNDPSRTVRLTALSALDVTDVETVRGVLETERDREVREVATQLIMIAESRGAPLAADRRGALRTTTTGFEPQIVFRPGQTDPATAMSVGDLRLELPGALDVPLTTTAVTVGGVVPAFASVDRVHVVFDDNGDIKVIDIRTRNIRSLGPGIAPRVIPFTDDFLFLRERERTPTNGGQTIQLRYGVYHAGFMGGEPREIGELHAEMRPGLPPAYSPVRRMVVADTPEGSVLRGEGITTFLIPAVIPDPSPRPMGRASGGRSNNRLGSAG